MFDISLVTRPVNSNNVIGSVVATKLFQQNCLKMVKKVYLSNSLLIAFNVCNTGKPKCCGLR